MKNLIFIRSKIAVYQQRPLDNDDTFNDHINDKSSLQATEWRKTVA